VANLPERFLVDEDGKRVGVVLDMAQYKEMIDALEELDSIRAYDAAKESGDEVVLFEQAIKEIEITRR
jgi:hypothetical protein